MHDFRIVPSFIVSFFVGKEKFPCKQFEWLTLHRPIKTNEMYKEHKIPKEVHVHPSGKRILRILYKSFSKPTYTLGFRRQWRIQEFINRGGAV